MSKIIDFKKHGNAVKFYLGEDDLDDYYGDDWDDRPYEHNAGTVYDEFVIGTRVIYFDYDDLVLEPCDGCYNSAWSKDDMKNDMVPCIIVVHKSEYIDKNFSRWSSSNSPNIDKFYFNDFLLPGVSYNTKELNMVFAPNGNQVPTIFGECEHKVDEEN